ncbi:MAG: gliding motility protein GldN [Tannerellaceae bacterium]|nr:gliding motility protein GldN [Tannerellaceae bacterium]
MKRLFYILVMVSAVLTSVHAQEENTERRTPQATRGQRETIERNSGLPDLTVRAQDMNERMTQEIGNARWMRVIYREIDLTKEENAPLYYPVRPMNGQKNLFFLLFQLMSEGKVIAYEYLDGYEAFDDSHRADMKTILDRAYIYYDEVPGRPGEQPSYILNESDIPSEDVRSYYVKEAWYFDQHNSVFDVKTLAICPILTTAGDFGEQRMPLFWLPYENIRPYITNTYIMTSNMNNAKTFTIDDYFRRRMFEGEIIKTENLMNRTLQEYYPEPDSLRLAQEQIEAQLKAFETSLYWQPDTITQVAATTKEKKAARATKASTKTTTKTKTPKAQSTSSSGSAPVRSVRRR